MAIISIIMTLFSDFIWQSLLLEWIFFDLFDAILIILLIYISIQFNQKLVNIVHDVLINKVSIAFECGSHTNETTKSSKIDTNTATKLASKSNHIASIPTVKPTTDGSTPTGKPTTDPSTTLESAKETKELRTKKIKKRRKKETSTQAVYKYVDLIVRSCLLLCWILATIIFESVAWVLTEFVFNDTYMSLNISMLILSFDCVIDILCVLLLFKFNDQYYNILCKCDTNNNNKYKCGCHYIFQSIIMCCVSSIININATIHNNEVQVC